jgi:transcriptional antiterminator RfaH
MNPGREGKCWYLVYAKPRQEPVAQENLRRQGYETYLPLIHKLSRRGGRRIASIGPMFPRYLFIRLDEKTDNWGPIRSTLGVASLVRFGQLPARVPEDLVAVLRAREDAQGLQPAPPTDELKPGQKIRVLEGSFSGFEGVFVARTGRERVVVLLEIMGKSARAALDSALVEKSWK